MPNLESCNYAKFVILYRFVKGVTDSRRSLARSEMIGEKTVYL